MQITKVTYPEGLYAALAQAVSTPVAPLSTFRWIDPSDRTAGFQADAISGTVEVPFMFVFEVTFWVQVGTERHLARTVLFGELSDAAMKQYIVLIRTDLKLRACYPNDDNLEAL